MLGERYLVEIQASEFVEEKRKAVESVGALYRDFLNEYGSTQCHTLLAWISTECHIT